MKFRADIFLSSFEHFSIVSTLGAIRKRRTRRCGKHQTASFFAVEVFTFASRYWFIAAYIHGVSDLWSFVKMGNHLPDVLTEDKRERSRSLFLPSKSDDLPTLHESDHLQGAAALPHDKKGFAPKYPIP